MQSTRCQRVHSLYLLSRQGELLVNYDAANPGNTSCTSPGSQGELCRTWSAHLEPDSRNISHSMTSPTKSSNQDLILHKQQQLLGTETEVEHSDNVSAAKSDG